MKSLGIYQSRITTKSRRLRTAGAVILSFLLAMIAFGAIVIMPSTMHSVRAHSIAAHGATAAAVHLHHVLVVQVLFAIAYWSFCGLLLISLFVIAWLDVREVTRQYLYERTTLVIRATEEMKQRLNDKTDENR